MKTRRISSGHYEIDTKAGTIEVDLQPCGMWYIRWPGQPTHDDVAPTLASAKEGAAAYEAENAS